MNLGTAPLTCQQSDAGPLQGTLRSKEFPAAGRLCLDTVTSGGKTVFRGAFSISSYLEGTGTNLRLPINPPFTPAETFVNYNNLALPTTTTDTRFGAGGLGKRSVCRSALRVWDPHVQPAITQQWNWNGAAAVGQQRHHPGGLYRAARNPPDGSHALLAETATAEQRLCHAALHRAELSSCPAIRHFSPISPRFRARPRWAARTTTRCRPYSRSVIPAACNIRWLTRSPAAGPTTAATTATGERQAVPANPVLPEPVQSKELTGRRASSTPSTALSSYAVYEIPFGRGKKFGHDSNKRGGRRLQEAGRLHRLSPSTRASRWHCTISAATRLEPILAACGLIAVRAPEKCLDGRQLDQRWQVHRLPVV